MNFLKTSGFKIGAATGIILHIVMLWTRFQFFPLKCYDANCTEVTLLDLPASMLYFFFDAGGVFLMSLIVGTAWWALLFGMIMVVIQKVVGVQENRY